MESFARYIPLLQVIARYPTLVQIVSEVLQLVTPHAAELEAVLADAEGAIRKVAPGSGVFSYLPLFAISAEHPAIVTLYNQVMALVKPHIPAFQQAIKEGQAAMDPAKV